ncbi:hypothetical protein IX329_002437 [Fusobacterium necrophorum]|nr:hypothetical protein [Fusobacterium necrophorum]MBR8734822.1 hypothetical protein [Fusobacterium necrophorum]MBR8791047.1 hypothetical protein [Fusobacterium necrophorum]
MGAIVSTALPNKIGGGSIKTPLPETAQVAVATGEGVATTGGAVSFTIPALKTGGAKVALIASGVGNSSALIKLNREKSSVRPDDTVIIKTETKNGVVTSRESYEVKNYKIENYNNMTSKIGEQAKIRVDELPKGTVQKVVIDARGQKLTTEIETKTIDDIVKKSNGIISPENIFFIK